MPRVASKRRPATQEVGMRLFKARSKTAMTQAQASQAIGGRQSLVSHYEAGSCLPPTPMLARLCRLYGVSIDSILDGLNL